MAIPIPVPQLGESITQAILVKWHKADGQRVEVDEPIVELETDKANVDVRAPSAGVLHRLKDEGDTVAVGEDIARVDPAGAPTAQPPVSAPQIDPIPSPAAASSAPTAAASAPVAPPPPPATLPKPEDLSPAVRRLVEEHEVDLSAIRGTGPGGRITKEDVLGHLERGHDGKSAAREAPKEKVAPAPPPAEPSAPAPLPGAAPPQPGVRRVAMSKIRRRIAERLVSAQQTAAILTTFNEIDMTAVQALRTQFKERFEQLHGVGLGFMSFFARAAALALKEVPHLNAQIDAGDILYFDHVHLGIAVSTERGLAVPVLRHVEHMSFARIEAEIKRLATATRDGKLSVEELSGGTFTITNGGIFGSLLSTPIINPPQSGILGLHAIQRRPVAIGDKIEIRPMMYVALSYDHRLVDGREAITFLVRVKQLVEEPARMMLEV